MVLQIFHQAQIHGWEKHRTDIKNILSLTKIMYYKVQIKNALLTYQGL